MAANAQKCDACGRMQYSVQRVALFVGGQPRVERDLCRSCLTEAIDGFLRVSGVTMKPPAGAWGKGVRSRP